MARRKRKKSRTKRVRFKLGKSKPSKKARVVHMPSLMSILKVLGVLAVLVVVGIGFVFLEKYVGKAVPVSERAVKLELVNVPDWVNEALKEKVYSSATAGGVDLKLDENAARLVQQNIEAQVAWLDEMQVRTTHESIRIRGRWRKPLAMVKVGLHKFYVDAEMVVLDFVPVSNLPIVNVRGLSTITKLPLPGDVWELDDLEAAMAILVRLGQMDELVVPNKPLLLEIGSIDVSNFNGRQNGRAAHIILYAKDNTEIIWGAELGTWQRYLEVPDEEKLAKLYGYYKEHGSLLSGARYINLRDPQEKVPLPVDKY